MSFLNSNFQDKQKPDKIKTKIHGLVIWVCFQIKCTQSMIAYQYPMNLSWMLWLTIKSLTDM